jgi:hypothetical protein
VAEVRKRGEHFWTEFEFYLSDLVVGLVGGAQVFSVRSSGTCFPCATQHCGLVKPQACPMLLVTGAGCGTGLIDGACSCARRRQQSSHVNRWGGLSDLLARAAAQAIGEKCCAEHLLATCQHALLVRCALHAAGWLAKALATIPSAFFEASVPVGAQGRAAPRLL